MRWKILEIGDTRIKTWFAIFPVIINKECRWLEIVNVKQIYLQSFGVPNISNIMNLPYYWKNIEFIDKKVGNNNGRIN